MKILVNEKISQHKFKTPEGYLVCVDSVLARTGKQTYRKNELFLDGDDSEIEIDRTPEEVFSEQTLASFENKPITLEHPHEDVTVDNYKDYAIGFVRDVKQGTFDGQPVILGTLVFTDAEAIREIEEGTRTELSCGYDCDIEDDENPRQTHIRGNHVALCEAGRAGIAKVIDSSNVKDASYVVSGYNSKNDPSLKKDIQEAKKYGLKISVEKIDVRGRCQLGLFGKAEDLIDFVENYLGMDSSGIRDSIEDKNYGGAFDIDPESYFTREDLMEFEDELERKLGHNARTRAYVDGNLLSVDYEIDGESYSTPAEVKIDMRKIKRPNDLNRYYLEPIRKIIEKEYKDWVGDSNPYGEQTEGLEKELENYEKVEDAEIPNWFESLYYEACEKYGEKNYSSILRYISRNTSLSQTDEKTLFKWLKQLQTQNEKSKDSMHDVDPRSGESKDDFIARFMEETKNEYPDEKQRLAVAYSYWKNKGKDSMVKDYKWKIIYGKGKPGKKEEVIEANTYREAKEYAAKNAHGWGFEIHNIDLTDSAVKDANIRLTLKKKKNDYGEFKVVCMKNGKYDEEGTYYTDDWDDAVGTLKQMAKQMGLNVTQNGNSYVADSKKAEDSLREPPESIVKAFEQQLAKWGIKIVGKGRTMMGRKHYQVETDMNPIKLHNVLKSIDIWLGKEQIPMTWSIGTDENGVTTAGIDLDKQFISDSKSKDASALDFEREVLSCWNAIKRENPDIYEEVLEGYKNADVRTLWGLLYEVADKTSLHRENPELFRRAKRVWNKYKNFDMNARNTVSFDSIYTLKIDGQKSRKLVRAKDASEAIEKYKKMFPKERIISVEQSEKFNKIVRNIPR